MKMKHSDLKSCFIYYLNKLNRQNVNFRIANEKGIWQSH